MIDRIRLNLAAKLAPDYQDNLLLMGFDAKWLEVAEVEGDKMLGLVKKTTETARSAAG
jgi:hypothetical protein